MTEKITWWFLSFLSLRQWCMSNPQHALFPFPLWPAHHECNPANISCLTCVLAFFMLRQSFRSSLLTHKIISQGCIKSPQVNTRGDFNFILEASNPGEHSSPATSLWTLLRFFGLLAISKSCVSLRPKRTGGFWFMVHLKEELCWAHPKWGMTSDWYVWAFFWSYVCIQALLHPPEALGSHKSSLNVYPDVSQTRLDSQEIEKVLRQIKK